MKKHSGINGNVKNALELSKAIECYTLTKLNFMHTNHPSMIYSLSLKRLSQLTAMSMLVFADDNTSLSSINYSVKLVMILKTDV